MDRNLSTLLDRLLGIESTQRFILGVDGLSRSGKTTLVHQLRTAFEKNNVSVMVLHMDDYIVERKRRYNTGQTQWVEYYHLQWDVDWLTRNLFKKLKDANFLTLPQYDPVSDTHHTLQIPLAKSSVVIVEGVFLLRQEWEDFFDYTVFLECPREQRFHRESASTQRNMDKFRERYWKAEKHYMEVERPKGKVDVVLQNDAH
ncbi:kinase [Marininema halotolerans]|uniref:Uridine kinase n=1 Tax=Marininema halotolerans TaxID=1155944 RepID=A0A1I6SL36_9BACL|nr:kinase [Marininema halotolerans]SFS77665.1 uridine kinase [Marininema halotolerans]